MNVIFDLKKNKNGYLPCISSISLLYQNKTYRSSAEIKCNVFWIYLPFATQVVTTICRDRCINTDCTCFVVSLTPLTCGEVQKGVIKDSIYLHHLCPSLKPWLTSQIFNKSLTSSVKCYFWFRWEAFLLLMKNSSLRAFQSRLNPGVNGRY